MITYADPATTYRAVPPKDARPQKQSSLVAHWTRVHGKLVCQWLTIQSQEQ